MIATNAFKQAVVGTYTASDTVIELNSISDTVGASDYLPNGGFNLILYDGLFGNPADANNAGDYEILECTGVNYATNEITVVREVENTTAVTIGVSSWQVVYGATKELLESLTSDWGDIGGTLSDQTDLQNALDAKIPTADIINDLTTGGATKVLSAEQGKELDEVKASLTGGADANFTAMPQVGGEEIKPPVQIVRAISTTSDSTTSTTFVDTSLEVTITPFHDDSILIIEASGRGEATNQTGESTVRRDCAFRIRNTTDDESVQGAEDVQYGRRLVTASTSTSVESRFAVNLRGRKVVNSKTARTFKVQFLARVDAQTSFRNDSTTGIITIKEYRP